MNIGSNVPQTPPTLPRTRNALITIWLVAFCYLGTFYIVLCTLSAYQVLQRARAISGDDSTNVTALIERSNQIAFLEGRRDRLQNQLETLSAQISEQQEKVATFYLGDIGDDSDAEFYSVLDPLVDLAGVYSGDLIDPEDYYSRYDEIMEGLSSVDDQSFFDGSLAAFEQARQNQNQVESLNINNEGGSEAEILLNSLSRTFDAQNQDLISTNRELSRYTPDQRQQAAEIVVEVRSLRPIFHVFVTQAESVLVFLLAIAMGALGSTIHITQSFLAGETHRPLTWYLIRPLLGTVTAVAIYILAKAGQLAIDPNTTNETMSPWFISFLAIISGLLSEHAIERITSAGKTFFETDAGAGSQRWALQLSEKMSEHGIESERLAAALGVPPSKLDAWANAVESVPQHAQDIIAAWLRLPLRELFSDIEPA